MKPGINEWCFFREKTRDIIDNIGALRLFEPDILSLQFYSISYCRSAIAKECISRVCEASAGTGQRRRGDSVSGAVSGMLGNFGSLEYVN